VKTAPVEPALAGGRSAAPGPPAAAPAGDRFDALAIGLARAVSRREALRWLGTFVGGALLAPLGGRDLAWALDDDKCKKAKSDCEVFCCDAYPAKSRGKLGNRNHCLKICRECEKTGRQACVFPLPGANPPFFVGCCCAFFGDPNVSPCPGPDRTCCPQPNGIEVCGANCGGGHCCGPGLECCGEACISPDTQGCCGTSLPYVLDTEQCCITTDAQGRPTLFHICPLLDECCDGGLCCRGSDEFCLNGECLPCSQVGTRQARQAGQCVSCPPLHLRCGQQCCPPGEFCLSETTCVPCPPGFAPCGELRNPTGIRACCPSGSQCCGQVGINRDTLCCHPGTECCDIQGAFQPVCIPTGTTCCGAPGLESTRCLPAAPVCCTDLPRGVPPPPQPQFPARAYCCRSGAECCKGACCAPGTYCCRVPSPDATGRDTACCFVGQTCCVIDGVFRCSTPGTLC
jgi:hypothetical protein